MQEPSCPAASTPRGAWGALVPSASPPGVRGLRDSSGTSRWQARWAQALWVQAPCLSLMTLFEVVSRACPRSTDRRTKVRSGTTQATCSGVRTCTRSAALGPGTEPLLPAPVQQEGEEPSVGTGSLGLWGHSDRVAFRDIEASGVRPAGLTPCREDTWCEASDTWSRTWAPRGCGPATETA